MALPWCKKEFLRTYRLTRSPAPFLPFSSAARTGETHCPTLVAVRARFIGGWFLRMKLSTLAIFLGLGFGLAQIYGLLRPAKFREAVRKFPRSEPWGYALMLLGTAWFLWNLKQENISDFASYKPYMLAGFGLVGVATCVFVRDFLAVRGFAIVLLLLAKFALDTQRWADTNWKNVIATWAYVWVIAGICFTIWPWWMRDWINWNTANDRRTRIGSALRLVFGLFVAVLGLTVFREVERKSELQNSSKPSSALRQVRNADSV